MIKIGILGYTDGNGHPYSYSSIFNGYNNEGMKKCPFKTIPEYLNNHKIFAIQFYKLIFHGYPPEVHFL